MKKTRRARRRGKERKTEQKKKREREREREGEGEGEGEGERERKALRRHDQICHLSQLWELTMWHPGKLLNQNASIFYWEKRERIKKKGERGNEGGEKEE